MKKVTLLGLAVVAVGSLIQDSQAMQKGYTPGVRGKQAAELAAQSPVAQAARKKADEKMARVKKMREDIKDLRGTHAVLAQQAREVAQEAVALKGKAKFFKNKKATELEALAAGIEAQINEKRQEMRKELGERDFDHHDHGVIPGPDNIRTRPRVK